MRILVAYDGRSRAYEHAPNVLGEPLCGAAMDERYRWRVIDGEPQSLCGRCRRLLTGPVDDLEKLRQWKEGEAMK